MLWGGANIAASGTLNLNKLSNKPSDCLENKNSRENDLNSFLLNLKDPKVITFINAEKLIIKEIDSAKEHRINSKEMSFILIKNLETFKFSEAKIKTFCKNNPNCYIVISSEKRNFEDDRTKLHILRNSDETLLNIKFYQTRLPVKDDIIINHPFAEITTTKTETSTSDTTSLTKEPKIENKNVKGNDKLGSTIKAVTIGSSIGAGAGCATAVGVGLLGGPIGVAAGTILCVVGIAGGGIAGASFGAIIG